MGSKKRRAARERKAAQPPVSYEYETYKDRDNLLREIGYNSYYEYLSSELWESIRLRRLEQDNYLCVVCGNDADSVHHGNYSEKTLLGLELRSLMTVCRDCHKYIEFGRYGKRTLRCSKKASRRLLRKVGKLRDFLI